MHKCLECGAIFEEPIYKTKCFEVEYGVASLFSSRHDYKAECCPNCDSEDIKKLEQCDCCGNYFEELIDTEGMVNGGIGYLCEQCCKDGDIE